MTNNPDEYVFNESYDELHATELERMAISAEENHWYDLYKHSHHKNERTKAGHVLGYIEARMSFHENITLPFFKAGSYVIYPILSLKEKYFSKAP